MVYNATFVLFPLADCLLDVISSSESRGFETTHHQRMIRHVDIEYDRVRAEILLVGKLDPILATVFIPRVSVLVLVRGLKEPRIPPREGHYTQAHHQEPAQKDRVDGVLFPPLDGREGRCASGG